MAAPDKDAMKRMSKMTEGQIDCLRLVASYHSSKEIARKLEISPHTVDQRLKRAQSILKVNSRFDAARLLSSLSPSVYGDLVYQSPDIPDGDDLPSNGGASSGGNTLGAGDTETLHQTQAIYDPSFGAINQRSTFPFVPLDLSGENELSVAARIGAIMVMLFLIILATAALVSLSEGISRLV